MCISPLLFIYRAKKSLGLVKLGLSKSLFKNLHASLSSNNLWEMMFTGTEYIFTYLVYFWHLRYNFAHLMKDLWRKLSAST